MGATTGGVEPTVYESIRDLPIRVWLDCIEKGVDNLVIDWNGIGDKSEWADWLKLKWQDIDDQIIGITGVSKEKQEYYHARNRYRIALAKAIQTKHPLDQHYVKHVAAEVEALREKMNTGEVATFYDIKVTLQKHFYVFSMDICTEEYFTMIKQLQKAA